MLKFFEDTEQAEPRGTIALRLLEQLYYKPDVLNARVYDAIQFTMPDEEKADWAWPADSKEYMAKLCRYVFAMPGRDVKTQRRASMCQAYHLAQHDHFQAARDLLHLGNLQEQAQESSVDTQILYNRVVAQMGLCAFRLGKVQEAHKCLMDVCQYNKARELLAQGLSFSKNMDRTPEQERQERLRQLPYHMHINLEVLETAHHICAMLLEVPNMAMQSINPNRSVDPRDGNKGIISRVLRRALEQYDKQVFTGPPENPKEAVVSAAKGLQRGDWLNAMVVLEDLKIWDHIDPGHPEKGDAVKDMIKLKIKIEALRTYLFAYASIYDAFHLDQLVDMFDLPQKTVHNVISKMMIKEEITAFWDEESNFVLVQHIEPTPLQRLAMSLADRAASAVHMNESLVDQKGGYNQRNDPRGQGQGRWDQGATPNSGGKGKGGSRFGPPSEGGRGKGKGKGKSSSSGNVRNRGWDNARPMLRSAPSRSSTGAGWGRP
jgi:translation initiation factor 3 subunit C